MKRAFIVIVSTLACTTLARAAPTRSLPPPHADPAPVVEVMRYAMPSFGEVNLYRPAREPEGTVLFLSDSDGWTSAREKMARSLARKGFLVAGVSTPALMQAMRKSRSPCNNANYPLIDLARDVQHRAAVKLYKKPIVIGYGEGATLTYASIAQWPNAGYQGAISINPVARLASRKPWCVAAGFSASHAASGWRFVPNKLVTVPWVVMQQSPDAVADRRALMAFIAAVPHASLIDLPGNGIDKIGEDQLTTRTATAIHALLPPPIPRGIAGNVSIPDMPLTLVPPAQGKQSDRMAIAYSGDGGWVGIDRDLATQVAASGIPVVGIDSLSYFWSARTPKGAAQDLSRLIRGFGERWNKRKVLLIGYSFGADVLPYIIDNLDPDTRARIDSVALLGLSSTADFQFHLTSWIDVASSDSLPTIPAISRLRGMTLRCIRGTEETDSACPSIPKGLAQQYVVPGGHHFDRNAPLLGKIVIGQRKPGAVTQ